MYLLRAREPALSPLRQPGGKERGLEGEWNEHPEHGEEEEKPGFAQG